MKADQGFSNIVRQLKPASLLQSRFPRFRSSCQVATFRKSASSQRPFARALQYHQPITSIQTRYNTTSAPAPPSSVPSSTTDPLTPSERAPSYELTFTCKPCSHRSTHRISQRGYHHGTVLVKCPDCKNRHVFADHLKIFADKSFTIEDLMRDKGEMVKRGTLEGDLELWDDGTKNERGKA